MVFWKSFPLVNIIKSKLNTIAFKDLQFIREDVPIPDSMTLNIISNNISYTAEDITSLKKFIKSYFGKPPRTPILDIPEDVLIGRNDHIMYITHKNKIIGCIRYHYIGVFTSGGGKHMYCEDCFCIHPEWRKKGIGDLLLTKLHQYVNKHKIPHSIFLKEGRQLGIIHSPFYSGIYVYREPSNTSNITKLIELTTTQAYNLIDIYSEFNHGNIFIIRNITTQNQLWKLYKNNGIKIMVCFQDTYQRIEECNKYKKIGWITSWLETSNTTDEYRKDAAKQFVNSMYGIYDYIWANKEWIGELSDDWKIDGQFHWYTYQWTSSINIKKSYCLLM
jgi:GNAT superfamily N-acetyltransferase